MLKLFRRFLRSQLAAIAAEDSTTVDAIVTRTVHAAAELGHIRIENVMRIEPEVHRLVREELAAQLRSNDEAFNAKVARYSRLNA